ncbi:unnamed protein product [Schistosoma curassoni]|nr:unnamed protein product [Schistosoma curassoni]
MLHNMKLYFVISLLVSLAIITTNCNGKEHKNQDPHDFNVVEDTSADRRGAVRGRGRVKEIVHEHWKLNNFQNR